MNSLKLVLLYIFGPVLLTPGPNPSTNTSFVLSGRSEIRIQGTSSMHDWSMETSAFKGSLVRHGTEGNSELSNLIVEVEAGGLVSGKSGMEKDARKALEAEIFPLIRFEQTAPLDLPIQSASQAETSLVLQGSLQIRDQNQSVQIEVQINITEDFVRISGSHTVNMTDYGIEPPRALLGLIRTGEEVTIEFETIWEQS